MTVDRRIDKLYPALTAVERAVLLVESRKRGADDDPRVRSTMPREQQRELERLLRDVAIANQEIGMLLLALYEAARGLEWRWLWFEAVVARHNDRARRSRGGPAQPRPRVVRPPVDLALSAGDETRAGAVPRFLKGFRDDVVGVARQAYATEEILGEFSGELEGTDPLRPEVRRLLEETMERVGRLLDQLEEWAGPVDAPGDLSEELTILHGAIEFARRR